MANIFKGLRCIRVLRNEPLKRHTSIRIGGEADYFVKVYNQKALLEVLKVIKKRRLKYIILGAGTNVLFGDKGYKGVVISLHGDFKSIKRWAGGFIAGSGLLIRDLLKKCLETGYAGAEFLAGIPGTIGGAIKGNAGAFGHSISEIVKEVSILDEKFNIKDYKREEIEFGYRHSGIEDKKIILSAKIELKKMDRKKIEKAIKDYLKKRRMNQPKEPSLGCFFKNPLPESAGKLIDECGLKGRRFGDAMVSERHANFIVNIGRARAVNVLKLAGFIKKKVKKEKGIELKPEVRIVC